MAPRMQTLPCPRDLNCSSPLLREPLGRGFFRSLYIPEPGPTRYCYLCLIVDMIHFASALLAMFFLAFFHSGVGLLAWPF